MMHTYQVYILLTYVVVWVSKSVIVLTPNLLTVFVWSL